MVIKNESIKYCIQDCTNLYQIIDNFNYYIFDLFNLNIHNYPTLPSLAFGIYRSKYLKNYKIPLITGQIFNDIRKSYTGGSTDMYIPYGKNIFAYDVNSLYPFVMKDYPIPIGNITFFDGDISKIENNPFGFFEVEITAPDNLNIPILQTKFNTGNGTRTISPLGTWKDMLFSEEINNAIKFGYKFKILRGYLFEKDFIFTDYINEIIDLNNNKSLVSYIDIDDNKLETILLSNKNEFNISIGIASAITSYSRIHMSQFKSIDNHYNLYYSDTDSIYIDKPLDDSFISNELGKMKLEYIFNEAVFLSSKVYGGLFNNNSNQIVKIKGFKNKLSYDSLKSLLIKNNKLELNQVKWFKNIEEGNITLKNQIYTLIPTENKRQLIYKNNELVDTKPFIIDNNKMDSK